MYQLIYIDKKKKRMKYYIIIAVSVIAIILSIVSSTLIIKNYNDVLRVREEQREYFQKMAEAKYLEKEKQKQEKEERESSEDSQLQLTSTAQKERDNFKYNLKAQEEIDAILESDDKQVYLTFDDGPSKNTNKLLDELKKADVKATFFILGTNIKGREKELKRIYNEGHTVANHSFSHVYDKIYKTPQATFNEYTKTENELKRVLGKDFNSNLFRFPGGSFGGEHANQKKKSKEFFRKKNIAFVDWNSLTDDSVGADTNKEQLKAFNNTRKNKNSLIVLQHDSYTSEKTAGTVRLIIEQLKKEGYEFKNFNNILLKEEIVEEEIVENEVKVEI